jgi:hypothetical protein
LNWQSKYSSSPYIFVEDVELAVLSTWYNTPQQIYLLRILNWQSKYNSSTYIFVEGLELAGLIEDDELAVEI